MMLVSGSLGRCSAGVGADDAAFALSSHQTQTFIWKSLFCGESYTPARSDPLHPHLVWISAVKSLETPWRYPSTTLLQFFATALCAAVARPVTLGGASSRDKITILLPNKKRRDTFHGASQIEGKPASSNSCSLAPRPLVLWFAFSASIFLPSQVSPTFLASTILSGFCRLFAEA